MSRFSRMLMGIATLAAAVAAAPALAACSVEGPGVSCVMTGLDNPRGLAFGLHGALFVTEAGRGGAVTGPCVGVMGFNCFGNTGAVSRYWNGQQDRVASGLPSIGFVQGASARGPHDIAIRSPRARRGSVLGEGGAHITVGLEKDASVRSTPGRRDFAKLFHIPASTLYAPSDALCTGDCWTAVVDIGAFQPQGNTDPNRETDPYGLIADEPGVVLTDASRNWLLGVDDDGTVSRIASFPSRFEGRSTDAVPTTVARGPDGAFYVGELVGIPFTGPTRPAANIYRVESEAPHDVSIFLTGFNAIIDMAFQGDTLYVLQHWTQDATGADGRLLRLHCAGRPLACDTPAEVMLEGLDRATAFIVDRGALYMSLHGSSPAFQNGQYKPQGEVIRMELDDDATDSTDLDL
ncbi:MAG TPA: ScyD/ScyE family protein [Usitatibacter sp.]|jgi:hypothetical protein|nr:ScyD/ScyE family protein [Usitatibacter sp.]